MIVLDTSASHAASVAAQLSPLSELMSALHIIAEPNHHPERRSWVQEKTSRMAPTQYQSLLRFSPLWARYRTRIFFPLTRTDNQDLVDELSSVEQLDITRFCLLVANGLLGESRPITAEFLDPGGSFIREIERKSPEREALALWLLRDPQDFRQELIDTLHAAWDVLLKPDWQAAHRRLGPIQSIINDRLATDDHAHVLSTITPAAWRSGPTQVTFDKLQSARFSLDASGLILIPSFLCWPHVIVKADPELPVIVQFHAHNFQESNDDLTQSLVRRRFAALAEPGRWELCRHLVGESITTGELARRSGQPVTAVSRSLRRMRDLGLVSSIKDGRYVHHRMDASILKRMGEDALRVLLR